MLGVRIVSHQLSVTVEVKWVLTKHPILKRRRNWQATRTEITKPGAWQTADGTIYMHPTLYEQLKHETKKETP